MEFDNENSRCVSAGPKPDARVCVTLRRDRFEIDADGDGGVVLAMMASALAEVIKEYAKPGCWPEPLEQTTAAMWAELDDWEPAPEPEVHSWS